MSEAKLFALSALCLALCGCAVGPDYKPPAVPQPAQLTRSTLPTAGTVDGVAATWWTAFGSPALDALVVEALANSPTIEAARATLASAHQNVVAQRGFFLPSVQASYNASRQNVGETVSSPLGSGESIYNFHTASLNIAYTPDLFGGNRRQVESLLATEASQGFQLDAARLTLASNVVGGVLQVAMLKEQVALTGQAEQAMRQQLEIMRKLHSSGYVNGIDVATQETLLGQVQQSLPPLQRQLEQTRDLLAVLLGRTPGESLAEVDLAALRMPALPRAVASDVLRQRPDVRASEALVHAASANVGVASAARFPQLSITAALGGGATNFGSMFSASNTSWSIGGGVLAPIFAGGTLQARQRAAEADLLAAAAQYRGTVLGAFQNVADALYALDIDSRAVKVAETSEAAALTSLELTRSQLREGYGSRPAMLAARQAWLQARAATVAARGTLMGDTVALFQALGGGVIPS